MVSLHTLKDDLQSVVQEKKISYVRAVALEEKKRHSTEAGETAPVTSRSHTTGIVTAALILMLLGALAIGAVLYVSTQRAAGSPSPLSDSLIFAEASIPFKLDEFNAPDARRALAQARATSGLTLGAITRIVPTITEATETESVERAATFGEFLNGIGAHPPEELLRALSGEFFFGIHTVDENAPVIVIPVESYERAFAAMLLWEKTMNADLTPLFTAVGRLTTDAQGLPIERQFEDLLMRNYDVRALKDDDDIIQLFYAFPTRNVLIVAESPYSFTEALSRLRAERKL